MFSGQPFELPEQFFDENGDLDIEPGMRYLVSEGYIYNNDINLPQYGEELKEAHPGAHRFLECYYESQRKALSDRLIEDGYIEYFIEDGKEILRWTAKAAEEFIDLPEKD